MLPNWLNNAFADWNQSALVKNVHSEHGPVETVRKTFNRSALNVTVKETCAPCNNGWMSALESQVMYTLATLVGGIPKVFSNEDVRTLRRWAIKTHMMRGQVDRRDLVTPYSYASEDRNAIRRGHSDLEGWDVWIGAAEGVNGMFHKMWGVH